MTRRTIPLPALVPPAWCPACQAPLPDYLDECPECGEAKTREPLITTPAQDLDAETMLAEGRY